MGDAAANLITSGVETWNQLVEYAIGLLGMSPDTYNSAAWSIIERLNNYLFIPIASSLIVLFYVIGFCQECIDVKAEVRFETVIKSLVKLSITEMFVVFNLQIVKGIFQVGTGMVKAVFRIGGGVNGGTNIDVSVIDSYLRSLGDWSAAAIGYILINVFIMTALCVLAIMLFYTIMIRMIKILVIIPYGSLAFSTMAGGRNIGMTSTAFVKFVICLAGEASFIVIALLISTAMVNNGGLGLLTAFGITTPKDISDCNFNVVFFTELEIVISCLVTLGIVKGGQSILQKALAL